MNGCYFISGIDTNVGKTMVTGYLAKKLQEHGTTVITQKFIQTGNQSISEDVLKHREIMGCALLPEDKNKITMPIIYPHASSPHLASKIASIPIDYAKIDTSISILMQKFNVVLIEGAGGLMVPLDADTLLIDYLAQKRYPLILTTHSQLGSINHTLLSLDAISTRKIPLYAIAYNYFLENDDPFIANDTYRYLKNHLRQHFPTARWFNIPIISVTGN